MEWRWNFRKCNATLHRKRKQLFYSCEKQIGSIDLLPFEYICTLSYMYKCYFILLFWCFLYCRPEHPLLKQQQKLFLLCLPQLCSTQIIAVIHEIKQVNTTGLLPGVHLHTWCVTQAHMQAKHCRSRAHASCALIELYYMNIAQG